MPGSDVVKAGSHKNFVFRPKGKLTAKQREAVTVKAFRRLLRGCLEDVAPILEKHREAPGTVVLSSKEWGKLEGALGGLWELAE